MPGTSIPRPTDLPLSPEPLPPQITPILTALIHDPTMPSALFHSYARLYAASWRSAYRRTEALDFDLELVPLLGVRPTQARQHLRYLRFAKLLSWESDGANRYVIHFPALPGCANPESVVVDGFNLESKDIQQQQLKDSENPYFGKSQGVSPPNRATRRLAGGEAGEDHGQEGAGSESEEAEGAEVRGVQLAAKAQGMGEEGWMAEEAEQVEQAEQEVNRAALGFLERVGVWPDAALRIATKLVENQRRGHDYLPSLADVLGWIAYCFGDGKKNNVDQPAALLAANLLAGRRCPEKYRPQPVCSACGFVEGFCECEDEPNYRFPEGFLDFALKHQDGFSASAEYAQYYGARPTTIWGVCRSCHGFPCQCEED